MEDLSVTKWKRKERKKRFVAQEAMYIYLDYRKK